MNVHAHIKLSIPTMEKCNTSVQRVTEYFVYIVKIGENSQSRTQNEKFSRKAVGAKC